MENLKFTEILLKERSKQIKVKSFDQSLRVFGINLWTKKDTPTLLLTKNK